MVNVLFTLTPPEFYLWAFLCAWASEGNDLVAIPRKPPGPPGWKLYTRQHLKRILKSLEAKKFLVITSTPTNQHEELMVLISRRKRLNIGVQPGRQECSGSPLNQVFYPSARKQTFRQMNTGNREEADLSAPGRTSKTDQGPQLSLSSKEEKSLKAWVEMGQSELLRRIKIMEPGTLIDLQMEVMKLSPWARSSKVSKRAKLYAAIRYLQDGHQQVRKSPEAWVGAVASRADQEMRAWKDDSSGSDGRSQSREKYAEG